VDSIDAGDCDNLRLA